MPTRELTAWFKGRPCCAVENGQAVYENEDTGFDLVFDLAEGTPLSASGRNAAIRQRLRIRDQLGLVDNQLSARDARCHVGELDFVLAGAVSLDHVAEGTCGYAVRGMGICQQANPSVQVDHDGLALLTRGVILRRASRGRPGHAAS